MAHRGAVLPRLHLAILLAVACFSAPALADGRVALVIGNGAYQKVAALPNPPNDARDIATSLGRLGFAVKTLTDASFDEMRRALLDFGRQARGAEMAVVFYAGHGMEIAGENWLIPVDAELRTDIDAENEAIGLRTVMLAVSNATNLGLVMLDACRNNPFAAKMQRTIRTRAVDRGFVRVEPTDNVLVAYAAKDGTTANDGAGRNSPFTTALLKNLEAPGLEISFMFRNVRDDVMAATNREQQPFVYGSLSKEAIYLKAPSSDPSRAAPVASGPPPDPAPSDVAWNLMKDTKDVERLRGFVKQFPTSPQRTEAEARIAALVFPATTARFNEANARALATRQNIPLPQAIKIVAPSAAVPKSAVEYLGAWGGAQRWGGAGRQMILVVTNVDSSGAAIGILGVGPPTSKTFNQSPASYVSFKGTITDNGLNFDAWGGSWKYTFKLRPDELMGGQAYGPKNTNPSITIERIN